MLLEVLSIACKIRTNTYIPEGLHSLETTSSRTNHAIERIVTEVSLVTLHHSISVRNHGCFEVYVYHVDNDGSEELCCRDRKN
jgi:hypothetical protein